MLEDQHVFHVRASGRYTCAGGKRQFHRDAHDRVSPDIAGARTPLCGGHVLCGMATGSLLCHEHDQGRHTPTRLLAQAWSDFV